ncbi:hypothetical protein HMPREF9436_02311 [Faecalibacterium cf. prausnitzii KLE1255]|uniref:Uncharacterized protein n=1 Tax=Faecalibacterium cf. prausnitzii KLE1255 TaxID=748224 RepID=E2ZKV8_9FIRM|nr:hypothetical protein HMPREF9436_02311 [Faecalibacterium cf. prausnitzii KLE1255]
MKQYSLFGPSPIYTIRWAKVKPFCRKRQNKKCRLRCGRRIF